MKVVLCDSQIISGYDYSVERKIIENAGHEFVLETCTNEDEVIERCADADVLLDIVLHIGDRIMSHLKNCKGMVRYGIGVDEFDIPAATARGIKVCNVSRYCFPEVAIHATALILACSRQILHFDRCVRSGKWNSDLGRAMQRPCTQTVGILGFGNIAKQVASNLKGLGYNVVAYDPYVSQGTFDAMNVKKVSLDELYETADIITPHLHLTPETENMINADSIAKMKDGVIIINVSRGPLVNESDLVAALKSGKVAAAGIDVMSEEPMKNPDHPYCKLDNVILTPHVAYRSSQANVELFEQVAETAVALADGATPYNVLNAKDLASN